MYITIRVFRNYGEMVPAGVIVEPTQIRRFKDKVRDGKIVEITDYNKQKYNDYVSRMLNKEFSVDTAEVYAGIHYGAPETPETPETPGASETTDATETTDTQETPVTPEKPHVATVVKPKVAATVSKEA